MASAICPIIIDDHGDLMLFSSVQHAERALEALDVQSGAFVGYDAEGKRLEKIAVVARTKKVLRFVPVSLEVVVITAAESEPSHAEAVKAKLLKYLSATTPPIAISPVASLKDVIQVCVERGFISDT